MIEATKAQAQVWYKAATLDNAKKITFKVADWGKANPLKASGVVVLIAVAGITFCKLLYPGQQTSHPPK